MHPVLFSIGSFELASYGLMTALGYAAAAWYLVPRLKKINLSKDTFWNLLFTVFVSAVVGAKLLFIIVSWPQLGETFTQKLATILHDIRYGFVFFGGVLVAVPAAVIFVRRHKLPLLKTADFLMVAVPLGHALGRIGCFLAGCCYGRPTDLPWGVVFTDPHSLVPPELLGVPLHPVQLYESACNLVLFFVLVALYKRPHKNGTILLAYLAGYGLMRFLLEFFRADYRGGFLAGMSPSQLISATVMGVALAGWIYLRRTGAKKHRAN